MESQNSTASAAAPSTASTAPPVDPRQVLQTMLDGLGLQTKVEKFNMDGAPLLHIATAEPGRLIGKQGLTLNCLQFLLNRMLHRQNPEAPRVVVDCERYRERQRDDLLRSVGEAGDKVRRWGESVTIGPFGAYERRIIHLHMERDQELEAVSEGDSDEPGPKKMIVRVRQATPPAAPPNP